MAIKSKHPSLAIEYKKLEGNTPPNHHLRDDWCYNQHWTSMAGLQFVLMSPYETTHKGHMKLRNYWRSIL